MSTYHGRREAELSRMSNRSDFAPAYQDQYDKHGTRISAKYLGHRIVPNRCIRYKPPGFNTLAASVSRIDLNRASETAQQWFADAA